MLPAPPPLRPDVVALTTPFFGFDFLAFIAYLQSSGAHLAPWCDLNIVILIFGGVRAA
jgi:hypothetical protein